MIGVTGNRKHKPEKTMNDELLNADHPWFAEMVTRVDVWIENGVKSRDAIEEYRSSIEESEGMEAAGWICAMLYDIM